MGAHADARALGTGTLPGMLRVAALQQEGFEGDGCVQVRLGRTGKTDPGSAKHQGAV